MGVWREWGFFCRQLNNCFPIHCALAPVVRIYRERHHHAERIILALHHSPMTSLYSPLETQTSAKEQVTYTLCKHVTRKLIHSSHHPLEIYHSAAVGHQAAYGTRRTVRPCNICSHLAVYTILSCGDRFVDCSIRVDYFQLLWGFGDMPVMREG